MKHRKIIVNKFGGGIMTKKFINLAAKETHKQIKKGFYPIIVASALKGITDQLIEIYQKIKSKTREVNDNVNKKPLNIEKEIEKAVKSIKKEHQDMIDFFKLAPKNRRQLNIEMEIIFKKLKNDLMAVHRFGVLDVFYDRILSYGEKLSALIFVALLKKYKISAVRYKTDEVPIQTDDVAGDANIFYEESKKNIQKVLKNSTKIPVITGFIGRNKKGSTTTLGRGGTDTTACFVASALKAKKVILWKDVEGVMSADPRIVKKPKNIAYLSYEEAEESGKIIHDKAVQYVKTSQTPFEVRSISNLKEKTLIGPANNKHTGPKIIGFKTDLTLLVITDDGVSQYGFLHGISKIFNLFKVNMVLIRNTRDSLQIVVEKNNGNVKKAMQKLRTKKYLIQSLNVNMVSLIGTLSWKMVNKFNDALFNTCPDPQIGAFPYKNCVRLEAIVKTKEMNKVIRQLHKTFME
ncbi:MAG: aspartate kinase [Candidatus Moranbacteria bacterium]|nr:aspartate kinase [Candidatus Moranbacteria bacterium]